MQTISVQLSDSDYSLLRQLAEQHNPKNQSDVIRRALGVFQAISKAQERGAKVMLVGEGETRELVLV